MADKRDDLGALLSTDGLILPFDIALYTSRAYGELVPLINDDLIFSIIYKQFLEYIYNISYIRYATVNAL